MPERISNTSQETESLPSRLLTPEELVERKEELFEQLVRKASLDGDDVNNTDVMAGLIAEHSIDDALDFYGRIDGGVSGSIEEDLIYLFENPRIGKKHSALFKKIKERIGQVFGDVKDRDVKRELQEWSWSLDQGLNTQGISEMKPKTASDELTAKIDSYYAELLRHRAIKHSERPIPQMPDQPQTKSQKQAVEFLEQTYEVLEPHVPMTKLTEFVREHFYAARPSEDKRMNDPWTNPQLLRVLEKYLPNMNPYNSLVSVAAADLIITKLSYQSGQEKDSLEDMRNEWHQIAEKNRYRPLDAVYDVKKEKVEKDLKDELKEAMIKEGYSDVEVVWNEDVKEYVLIVRNREKIESKNKSENIDWGQIPNKKEWGGFPGLNPQVLCITQSGELVTKNGDSLTSTLKNGISHSLKVKEVVANYESGTICYIAGNDDAQRVLEIIPEQVLNNFHVFYEARGGENISSLKIIGGRPAFVILGPGGAWTLMHGENGADFGNGGENEKRPRSLFDLNGKVAYTFGTGKRQVLRINGVSETAVFDDSLEGFLDIQPLGMDDFAAIGYLGGFPIVYTKDKKYHLDARAGELLKMTIVRQNIVISATKGNHNLFEKADKFLTSAGTGNVGLIIDHIGLAEGKELVEVSASIPPDNYYICIYDQEGKYSKSHPGCVIPGKELTYYAMEDVNGTPFVIVKSKQGNEFIISQLNADKRISVNFYKEPRLVFESIPQVIQQLDRVIIAGFQSGIFVTYEWMKEPVVASKKDKDAEDQEVTLSWDALYDLYEPMGSSDDHRGSQNLNLVINNLIYLSKVADPGSDTKDLHEWLHFHDREKIDWKDRAKKTLSRTPGIGNTFNRTLKTSPEVFLDSMTAVQDRTDRVYVDHLLSLMVPGLQKEMERRQGGLYQSIRDAMTSREPVAGNFFRSGNSTELFGGDPEKGHDKELFQVNDDTREMYVTGIYTGIPLEKVFGKMMLVLDETIEGPTSEITATASLDKDFSGSLILPKRIGASIIPDRVKIIYDNGQEEKIEVKKNEYGEDMVDISWRKGMKSLVWSQEVPDIPYVPSDVSEKDYEKMRGGKSKEDIVRLSSEDEYFVKSLEGKRPKEKLEMIEAYVHSVSYYDFKNGEVMVEKQGLSPEERISFMQIRCRELAKENKTLKSSGKRYAGVCADFALLTTALMLKAGLDAGVAHGAVPRNGKATMANEHALSIAVWPEKGGKKKLAVIDGTPSAGLTEEETMKLQEIRFETLKEREKKGEKAEKIERAKIEVMLEEIERKIGDSKEMIEQIQNGELERMLNAVLKYEVKESHTKVVSRLFESARYGGLPVFSEELEDKIKIRKFLESELGAERRREVVPSDAGVAGTDLFNTFRDFIDRYAKEEGGDHKEAMHKIEEIIGIAEPILDKTENRVLRLLVQYLKAEKMKKGRD